MLLAQKLYESGKITYMRTDSLNLSDQATEAVSEQIGSQYGKKYIQTRKFKNKNESAQEAHEAIRPTDMSNMTVEDADCRRLYELIWKRTMASQMADAELEKTIAKIQISTNKEELTASGEVLKFDGFLKVYREVVTDFLKQYFDDIMDYNFTARIEAEFDEVASGKIEWNNMIDDFYIPFKKDVEKNIETAERISGERELGVDPVSGKKLLVRMGRYGPMAQIGEQNDEEKPRFAKLKNTQSIETINLEDALELFKLPRNLGSFEGADLTVSIGRFGPYIAHDKKFYSLGKEFDPYTISFEDAVPIVVEKRATKEKRTIKVFEKEKIQLLRGPYGPYIKQGLRNYKIPKERQESVETLELPEIKAIIEDVKANPPKRVPKKKKSS